MMAFKNIAGLRSLFIIAFGCVSMLCFSGNEKYSLRLAGDSILIDSALTIQDPFSPYNSPPSWTVKQSFGRVYFVYDPFATDTIPQYHSDSMVAKIRLDIKFEDKTGAIKNLNNQILKIVIYNNPDSVCQDRDVLEIPGAHKLEIKVKWLVVNGDTVPTPADTPNDIAIDAEIEVERYYAFSPDSIPSNASLIHSVDTSSSELVVSWGVHSGAEEYDLEWTYIDDYDTSTTPLPADSLKYDFRTNAIRVRLSGNSYRIPLTFERGWVLYRVRGIGRAGNNFDTLIYGRWSSDNFPGGDLGSVGTFTDKVNIDWTLISEHEPFLNWEHSAIYSEGGRRSDELRYYDGLGYERQRIRKNNSAQQVLVKELFYDEEKRLAVEAMEAPAFDDKLKFYKAFNIDTAGNPYSHNNFDTSLTAGCGALPAAMDSSSGAAKYYSSLNPDQEGFNAFLPSAFGYSFSQRVYTPDNTGRISKQGGVGATHQIGSGHETVFLYGQPEQVELDRLFGSEVGYATHYRKQVIRDPNGQISVNYYDSKGNLIASGLAGAPPLNLDSLDEPEGTYKNIHSDLMQKDSAGKSQATIIFNGNSLKISKSLVVTSDGNYNFDYSMMGEQFTDSCLPDSFCFDCHYILDISIKDGCGLEYVSSQLQSRKIGGEADTACQSTPLSFDSAFTVFLTVGEYMLTKTLRVDDSTLQQYALLYYQNNICKMDSAGFADSLRNKIDTSGCNIDCSICIDPPDTSGFTGYCDELCGYKSPCDGFFDMMIADVSPRGQYGKFPAIINSGRTDDLSVFNQVNLLSKNITGTGNYLFPDPFYRDPDGDTAYVKIHNNLPEYNTTFPGWQSWYFKIVQTDSANTDTFVVPQILKYLSDYIAAWKPSWALSLVKFHPEYCYYEWCHKQDSIISPCTGTSDNFDSLLLSTTKFSDAKALNLIDSGGTALTPLTSDPFFNCGTGVAYFNQMQGKINSMKPGIPFSSMKRISAFAVLAPAYYSNFIPDSLSSFCTSSDTAVNNAQWQFFRLLYLSAKQEIDRQIADSLALHSTCGGGFPTCGCYSGCIGDDSFNPYESGMYDPLNESFFGSHFDQPAWNYFQPCSFFKYDLYKYKTRRYANPDILVDFADAGKEDDTFKNLKAWAELQQYYATGQCPIEFDLQNLLAAFAQKNDLMGDSVPMFSYPQFTMRLYDSLAHPTDSVFIPVKWSGTISSDTSFAGIFSSDSGNCIVNLFSNDSLNWYNVRGFMNLYFNTQDSLGYHFSVIALLNTDTVPGTIDDSILLSGITCIPLAPCVFSPVCNITPQAKDASQLWAVLADTGLFASSTPVDLSQQPLNLAVSDRLLSYIGNDSLNIKWQRVSSYKTDSIIVQLFGSGADTLQFDLKTITPSGLDFDSVIAFTGLVNDTNLEMSPSNNFLITGWVSGSPPVPVPLSGSATIPGLKAPGQFLIMDCELPLPVQCEGNNEEYSNYDAIKVITKYMLRDTLLSPDTIETGTWESVKNLKKYFGGEILLWDSISLFATDTTDEDTVLGYLISITGTDTFSICPLRFIFPDSMPPVYGTADVSRLFDHALIDSIIMDGKFYDFFMKFNVQFPYALTDSLGDTITTGIKNRILKIRVTTCFPIGVCEQCEESVEIMEQDLIDLKRRVGGSGCTDCDNTAEQKENLVRNGSFELGDTLFTSKLAKVVGTCPDTAQYCVPDITNTSDSCVISFSKDSFICSANKKFLLAGEMALAEKDTAVLWRQTVESSKFASKDTMIADTSGSPVNRGGSVPQRPLCLKFNFAAHKDTLTQDTINILGRLGSQQKWKEYIRDTSSLWNEVTLRFSGETAAREASETDSLTVDIAMTAKKAGDTTLSDTGRINLPPVGIDSIILVECPCAPDTFSIPPGIPYPYHDDCGENMELGAIFDANYFYDAYSDSIVKNFKEVYTQKCLRALEDFTMDFVSKEQHFTLYYYNQAGNLVRTVSPKGVNMIEDTVVLKQVENARTNKQSNALTQHTLNNFYRYNSLDEQTNVNTPDGGYTTVFYDKLGRMIASQNSEQKTQNPQHYSYTKFDVFGRTIEAGELYSNTAPTTAILNAPNFPDNWSTARTEIIKTFFDSVTIAVTDFKPKNLRTRVSSTAFYDTTGTAYRYATHYDYDMHGNVKTVVQDMIPLQPVNNRYKRMDYKFDLISGKVLELNYQKGGADYFSHKYFYDSDNRLIETHTTTDGVLWDRDAKYFYYDHGPLGRVELGRQRVQGTDYAYTLQGWVKGINSATLLPDRDMGKDGIAGNAYMGSQPDIHRWVARDEFSYMLDYFDGDYQGIKSAVGNWQLAVGNTGTYSPELFNGNIRLSAINIKKFDTLMVYAYRYDQLNRLTQMRAFDNADIANNTWSAANPLEKYATNYTYDPNGNILRMKRNGATPTEMDSLQYFYYANKNQLAFIKDSVPANFYSDDLDNQSANNYQYDKIGNLFSDASEEIQQIKWTVYGKVKKIKRTGTSKKPQLDFEYDALNNRVRKVVKDSANKEVETFYVRDVQGNILATYNYVKGSGKGGNKLYLDEQVIYGSSRIGTIKRNKLLPTKNLIVNLGYIGLPGKGKPIPIPINPIVTKRYSSLCGSRRYELDSWNGNVQTVISDKKVPVDSNNNGWVDYYTANVISAYDYSNGVGAILPNRIFERGLYNFGAQGSLVDKDIKANRNLISTFYRGANLETGQWWSPDPKPDPSLSPYVMLNRNPVWYMDPLGDTLKFEGRIGFKIAARFQFALLSVFSKTAREKIKNLKESKNIFTVKEISTKNIGFTGVKSKSYEINDKNKIGAGADFYFNFTFKGRKIYKKILASDKGGSGHIWGRIVGHEITHADDIEEGVIDRSKNAQGVRKSEAKAVKEENTIYKELKLFDKGIRYRQYYSKLPVIDYKPDPDIVMPPKDIRSIDEIENY